MARLRRRWRVVKWVALLASVTVTLGWVATTQWHSTYTAILGSRLVKLSLVKGSVEFALRPDQPSYFFAGSTIGAPEPGLSVEKNLVAIEYFRWGPGIDNSVTPGWTLGLPLWIPFLLVAIPTVFLFWRDRRRIPPHCCRSCGYDLTGNTSGVCPECAERV